MPATIDIDISSSNPNVTRQKVENSIGNLYEKSATFRALYDYAVNQQDEDYDLVINVKDGGQSEISTPEDPNGQYNSLIIDIATNEFDGDFFVTSNVSESFERIFVHEFAHIIDRFIVYPSAETYEDREERARLLENKIMNEAAQEDINARIQDAYFHVPIAPVQVDENNYPEKQTDPIFIFGNDYATLPDSVPDYAIDDLNDFIATLKNLFNIAENVYPDPLVLDLNGDNTIDLNAEHTVYFDTDNDGFAEAVNWVGADDGLLARDVNENGNIDNITELFGNADQDGFSALAAFDLNHDSLIDQNDAVWADLVVWQDTNQNGYSESSELLSLASLGITAINLASVVENTTNPSITQDGTVTTATGEMKISNVLFDTDYSNTRYIGDYTLDIETLALPTLRGHGTMVDLHIAASMDTSLDSNGDTIKDKLVDLSSMSLVDLITNIDDVQEKIKTLIYQWAGASNNSSDNAKSLLLIEHYINDDFYGLGTGTNPGPAQQRIIDQVTHVLLNNLTSDILVQLTAGKLFDSPVYDFQQDAISAGNFILSQDALDQLTGYALTLTTTAARQDFWNDVAAFLQASSYSIQNADGRDEFGLTSTETAKLADAVYASDASLSWGDISDDYLSGISDYNGVLLTGDGTDNNFSGTSLNDHINGGSGDDTIYGSGGNDTLEGSLGSDTIEGGDGDDQIWGLYDGMATENVGNILDGGLGDDVIFGSNGDDILIDGYGTTGQNLLDGGAGINTYRIVGSAEVYIDQTSGGGIIELPDSYTDESELAFERLGNMLHITGAISGSEVNIFINNQFPTEHISTIKFDSGYEYTLTNGISGMIAYGTDQNDNLGSSVTSANNTYVDVMHGLAGNDSLSGGYGDDELYGDEGNDTLLGGSGADHLYGGSGNDTLISVDGNDFFDGGEGDDLYKTLTASNNIFVASDGNDTINAGPNNTLLFQDGVTYNDLSFSSDLQGNLIITHPTGMTKILSQFANSTVETLKFSDDSEISISSITTALITTGTASPNTIYGINAGWGNLDDTINAGAGNDVVYGGLGNDHISGEADNDTLYGEGGNDTLHGGDGDDKIYGGDGDDEIYGNGGNNYIDGGAGDDVIDIGEVGTIRGGLGNDTLIGGANGNEYSFALGDGADTIEDFGTGQDQIHFGPGLTLSDLTFTNVGESDLEIGFVNNSTDKITILNFRDYQESSQPNHKIEQLRFFNSQPIDLLDVLGPQLKDDAFRMATNTILTGNIFTDNGNGIDSDGNGEALTVIESHYDGDGALTVDENGDFTFIPATDFEGNLTFTYTVSDPSGVQKTANAYIEVVSAESFGLEAKDDAFTIIYGDLLTGNLLADNGHGADSDALGRSLSIPGDYGWQNSANGRYNISENGDFSYTPDSGFVGTDTFEYSLYNDAGGYNQASVTITIDAPAGSIIGTSASQTLTGSLSVANNIFGLDGNDALNGGNASDSLYGGHGNDTLTGGANNDYLYGGEGNDIYIFNPGNGQDVIFDADGTNDTIRMGSGIRNFNVVLTRIDDDLEITFTNNSTDRILITGHFNGGTRIETLNIANGNENISLANHLPSAINDEFTIDQHTALTGNVFVDNGYGADSDADGDTLWSDETTFTTAAGATVVMEADGDFTYTPPPSFSGADYFDYTIYDQGGDYSYGHVDITVHDTNTAPAAQDDEFEVDDNLVLSGNVLDDNGNGVDSDSNGDTLTVTADTFTTSHGGAVVLNSDGSFTYTPSGSYLGADSFDYTVLDPSGASDTATAYITINEGNDAPIAKDDNFTATPSVALGVPVPVNGNLLSNNGNGVDSDGNGDTLTILEETVTSTQGRIVTISSNGAFSYTAPYGYVGTDSFDYTVSDEKGGTDTGTAYFTISAPSGATLGTSTDDTITGTSGIDKIYGLEGNDIISGGSGNDLLYGWDGNDTINGDTGTDQIIGGRGADMLSGGADSDTYLFESLGSAAGDIIEDNGSGTGNAISFKGLTADLSLATAFSLSSDSLDLLITTEFGTVTIKNQFAADASDRIAVLNWLVGDSGTATTRQLTTGMGFIFNGDEGNNTITMPSYGLAAGYSNKIYGYGGSDVLTGGTASSYLYGGDGNDTIAAGTGKLYAYGEAGNDTITASASGGELYGGDGDDTIYGGNGSDQIYAGTGTDFLSGGGSNDQYTFFNPDEMNGDVISDNYATSNDYILVYGATAPTFRITNNNKDLTIEIDGKTLTIKDQFVAGGANTIENFTWYSSAYGETAVVGGYIKFIESALTFTGTNANDIINMPLNGVSNINVAHTVLGLDGDDTITGSSASGLLYGGNGNDTINGGSYSTNVQKLYGEDGNDTLTGSLGIDYIYGGTGTDSLTGRSGNDFLYGGDGNDTISGGDNNDTLYGDDGNDALTGGNGTDSLYGGAGADTMSGENNGDSYYFETADSAQGDIIEDNGNTTGDVVYFSNISSAPVFNTSGTDLYVITDWGVLTIKNQFFQTEDAIESIQWRTGSSGAYTTISLSGTAYAYTFTGAENNDTISIPVVIYGRQNNSIYGMDGDDTITGGNTATSTEYLHGGNGNDTINAQRGTDYLYGEAGNDILNGGDQNDVLYGGADADIFKFTGSTTTMGVDTIADFSTTDGDKIDLASLLTAYDPLTHAIADFVQITDSGSDSILKIDIDGGGNSFAQIATITGVTGLTDEAALVTSGNLIVHA